MSNKKEEVKEPKQLKPLLELTDEDIKELTSEEIRETLSDQSYMESPDRMETAEARYEIKDKLATRYKHLNEVDIKKRHGEKIVFFIYVDNYFAWLKMPTRSVFDSVQMEIAKGRQTNAANILLTDCMLECDDEILNDLFVNMQASTMAMGIFEVRDAGIIKK